jgi:hypothetical protein
MGRGERSSKSKQGAVSEADIEQEIRQLAYELHLKRVEAGVAGDEMSDWIAAEAEVRKRHES